MGEAFHRPDTGMAGKDRSPAPDTGGRGYVPKEWRLLDACQELGEKGEFKIYAASITKWNCIVLIGGYLPLGDSQ